MSFCCLQTTYNITVTALVWVASCLCVKKAFCSVQLHHYYYVEYRKNRSLGRYCSFCTRQTSLDSLKICNCIPTSTRTTLKICGFCAPAEDSDIQHRISTCVDHVSEWLPTRNSRDVILIIRRATNVSEMTKSLLRHDTILVRPP